MKLFSLFIVLQTSLALSSNVESRSAIKWKYLALDNNSDAHQPEDLLDFKRSSVGLSNAFTIHESLNLITSDSILYGIDLSNNEITDGVLQRILEDNQDLFRSIKLLNLSGNSLKSWPASELLLENLEVLILDDNYQLKKFKFNSTKIKVLSLNKCNLAYVTEFYKSNLSNLVYLGIGNNKLTDISNKLKIQNLLKSLLPKSIQRLDLSLNKLTKMETIHFIYNSSNIKQLNLEKNLFSHFNINELIPKKLNIPKSFINLKYNFIRNTSVNFYKLKSKQSQSISIELVGNPLMCDCNSMWILEKVKDLFKKKEIARNSPHKIYYKRKKNLSMLRDSRMYSRDHNEAIKLVFKRSAEKISSHYLKDDPNFEIYLKRQKRLRLLNDENKDESIEIIDLNKLTCNFVDVQNSDKNNSTQLVSSSLNSDFLKQNFFVNSIRYKEKQITKSIYDDYICTYEDHCVEDECNCCVFKHCHCRSICPRQCRCYFDTNLQQNIIDCSTLNLIEIPEETSEAATDMRLNANNLKFLKSHSFFGFGKLKYLYLQDNQISYISSESFDDLNFSLKILNLAGNQLNYLNGNEFDGLNQLTVLILDRNPLKDIENIDFISSKNLPNLQLIHMYQTKILEDTNQKFIEYSKVNSNATILYQPKAKPITTTRLSYIAIFHNPTTNSTLSTTWNNSNKSLQLNFDKISTGGQVTTNDQVNKTRLMNRFFNRFKLFNWYYFPVLVFVVCLVLSLVIISTVVIAARRIETDHRSNILNGDKIVGVVGVGGGAFLSSNYSSNLNTIQSEDDDDSSSKLMVNKYCTCISTGCRLKRDFDSCEDFYNEKGTRNYDSSTVPVSRCIENLNLNVCIYYNIIDTDYVTNYLQPLLKKCITIVPDTKFFCKPQMDKYVKLSPDSMFNLAQTNSSTLMSSFNNTSVLLLDSNSSSTESTNSSAHLIKPNQANLIVANILVISDNFYGYKPISDSFVSLKTKTNAMKDYSSSAGASMISSSSNSTNKKSHILNADNCFKHSFKIYINLDQNASDPSEYNQLTSKNTTTLLRDNSVYNSSKTFSLNKRLMKRIYESHNSKSICSSDNKVLHQIQNDMFSSNAYYEKLQFKLEKFLQHICLKSNKFSNNNFSYVDYTKR